jgi:RNA polymerase sigma factor (sigma-70 family)
MRTPSEIDPDVATVVAAQRGDRRALDVLAAAYLPLVYNIVGRAMNGHPDVDDVVQETMLRAIRDLANYDPQRARNNILPWLIGLARNEIQRVLQREKSTASLQLLWDNLDQELIGIYSKLEEEPFGDEVLQRQETRDLVNATMAQLPDHYRESLEEKYVQGRSQREMAERWQLTEKALESQLSRARHAFRATFLALSRQLQMEVV